MPTEVVGKVDGVTSVSFYPIGVSFFEWENRIQILAAKEKNAKEIEEEKQKKGNSGKHPALASAERMLVTGIEDLYEVLDLSEQNLAATDDEIQRQYKKMLLVYHPDKEGNEEVAAKDEKTEKLFLLLTKAYETLTDPKKRVDYDSGWGSIDDSIPRDPLQGDFFEVYGPVFARNARWSEEKPVPLLGDDNTPYDDVMEFYDFWFDFKSWREFPQKDEHPDLAKAESREERRWMEQQNKKERTKAKKEEMARIKKFVERAEKADPRIRRHLDAQKAKKNMSKDAKVAEKKAKEDAEKKAKEEERLRKEAEDKIKAEAAEAAKKAKEAQKREQRKQRSRFRTLATGLLDAVKIEYVCENLDHDSLVEAGDMIEALGDNKAKKESAMNAAYEAAVAAVAERENAAQQARHDEEEERQRKEAEARMAKAAASKPWTPEEFALLIEGYKKFPGGTPNRWKQVAEHIKTRTEDEAVMKAKEIQRDGLQARAAVMNLRSKVQAAVDSVPGGAAASTSSSSSSAAARRSTTEDQDGDNAPMAPWTQEEQNKLEKALQQFPASLPKNDRFAKISEVVGRSKKDCFARFKELAAAAKGGK